MHIPHLSFSDKNEVDSVTLVYGYGLLFIQSALQ